MPPSTRPGHAINFAEPPPASHRPVWDNQAGRCSFYRVFSSLPPASSSPSPSAWGLLQQSPSSQYHLPQHLPVNHLPRPAAEIRRRKMVAGGLCRAWGPPGIFSQWVWSVWVAAVLGYQIPPRLNPKPRPTSCPALRRWASLAPLLGPLAGELGGSPWRRRLQIVSGEEPLLAPVAATTPLRGGCFGGGKRLVQGLVRHWKGNPPCPPARESRVWGAYCTTPVKGGGGSELGLCPSLALGKACPLSEPLCPHFFFLILINLFVCIGS